MSKIKNLRKRAWTLFSKMIRLENSKDGYCVCVTCGKRKPIKEIDAGHWLSRRYLSTKFDERNVHPQCARCNRFLNSELEYYEYMRKTYGEDVMDMLRCKAKRLTKLTAQDYEDMIKEYKERIKLGEQEKV